MTDDNIIGIDGRQAAQLRTDQGHETLLQGGPHQDKNH
jgi:hypothetical protein